MKGIILAGGSGTRLYPLTHLVSKQLLPVYDKPAIYYPLSTLLLSGIREILIISTPRDLPMIRGLLGDGKDLGIRLEYAVQTAPRGIADAFLVGESFLNGDGCCLILGDNVFVGHDLPKYLQTSFEDPEGATVFAYRVQDPERYGVVDLDSTGKPLKIVEKPRKPLSNWAITGIYFYDNDVVRFTKDLKPSRRGELEITELNQRYLSEGRLRVVLLGRGIAWLDIGTHDSLLGASQFVHTLEERQGLKIACIEEIAYLKKYITKSQLLQHAKKYSKSSYGEYLERLANEDFVV